MAELRIEKPTLVTQVEGAVLGGDVAKGAAGADRPELLVVADQPDGGALVEAPGDDVVEGEGVGHAGLVDDHQSVRPDRVRQRLVVGDRPDQLGEVVGDRALAEL